MITSALAEADLRVLIMVLYHMMGDEVWLGPAFAPARDVRLIADETAGFSDETAAAIRNAAHAVLTQADAAPVITDPGDDLMVRMMSHCLAEPIPADYAPMMREQMGFIPPLADLPRCTDGQAALRSDRPVLIVGAGISGMALGVALKTLNIPFEIVEAAPEVGGTWWYNRYPGCGVDTPNHAYSFSYGKPFHWRSYFSPREDLINYATGFADEMGLRPHIRFEHKVTAATWDDDAAIWRVDVETPDGPRARTAPLLVSCVGHFNLPATPDIQGADSFSGTQFHTARWPDDLSIKNKRVGIIGTGASAMQIVPSIVDEVAELTIYQRSPQWARPIDRYHDKISDGAKWLLDHVPFYNAWFRFTMLWRYGDGLLPFLKRDPDWHDPDRSLNRVNDRHRAEMTAYMEQKLATRPDLLAQCVPTYPPYGKRILLDNGWYDALLDPKVELVTDKVTAITQTGVMTDDDAQRDCDILIWSTGFKVGLMAAQLNITGKNGVRLTDRWNGNDPRAHLGMTMPDFPNLFVMLGPNTGLGHGGSTIMQAEVQARYIAAAIAGMTQKGASCIEVRQDRHDSYIDRVDREHQDLIWTHPGMTTYYRNEKGRVYSVMPWRLVDYWTMCRLPDWDDFHLTG